MKLVILAIIVGSLYGSVFSATIAHWFPVSQKVHTAWHPTTHQLRDRLLERLEAMDVQGVP